MKDVLLYDTTLRDGCQAEDISFTLEDKLRIAEKLEDLVEDKRYPNPQRYLRKVYPDPMTGSTEWGLIPAPGGQGIMGVYSLSEAAPIKTGNFSMAYEVFHGSSRYSEWQFFYNPEILQYEAR